MSGDRGRYSRVSRRIWNDGGFRALSQPKPCGAWLFFRLLTGPELTSIPGLFQAWEAGLAQALGWSVKDFRRCFAEVEGQGLAKCDRSTGLYWLPKAIRHNEPESPNVVAHWRRTISELPDCQLLNEATDQIAEYLTEMGPEWIAAWKLSAARVDRPVKIPAPVRQAVQERDGSCCRYCGKGVSWKDRRGPAGATYDHVDPAGPSTEDNLVIACRSCNSIKGFRTPELAGMTLIDLGRDPGSDPGRTWDVPGNQDQDQDQDPDSDRTRVAGARGSDRPVSSKPEPLDAGWLPPDDLLDVLVAKHDATPEQIRRVVPEFRRYWITGKGAGKRRGARGWEQAFTNRVAQLAKNEELYAGPRGNGPAGGQEAIAWPE